MALDFYGTRREDLLGSMVSTLTGGRVSKVKLSATATTGFTSYDTRTGEVKGIVLPQEQNLPEGCTMEAAQGLMDHEAAHAIYTNITPGSVPRGLLMQVANILEDPRVEKLFMKRYLGAVENIGALTELGFAIIGRSLAKGGHAALDLALLGLSLEAYGQDTRAWIGSRPHAEEVLAFLDSARPHVVAALQSKDTGGVIAQSKAIVALLKDASAHVPPQPTPSPCRDGESAEGEDEGEGSSPSGAEGEDEGEGSSPSGAKGEDEGEDEGEDQGSSPSGAEGDHNTDPLSKGGSKPSALAEEALAAAEDFDPKRFNPAEAVLDQLKEAIEKEVQRIEKEKQEDLLRAQRSGLVCPLGTAPAMWKEHEKEIREEVTADHRQHYPSVVDQLRSVIMGVRHALRIPLMAQGRSRVRTGRDYGDLDPAAVVHVAMGTSDRVFQRVTRGKTTKTAVFLLVDQSGSMNGNKIAAARMAAVALSEALCGLPGLHTEIGGFTHSCGVSSHRIAKTFRDRKAEGAMALGSGGGNADGSAVRWAARRLLTFPADRRVLIVLSDGWPTDGPQPVEDLRAAVEAAERHGIETMGIGILDNSVEAYYPKHVVIHQVGDLAGTVLKSLAGLFSPEGIARAKVRVRAAECA